MRSSNVIVIKAGTLVDGTGKPALDDAVILIEGSRIAEVGQTGEVDVPTQAALIDATEKVVIPGMIDSHVHLHGDVPSPYARWHLHGRLGANTMIGLSSSAWIGLVSACNGREWLDRGFTTIRDLGFSLEASMALKKAQEMGLMTSSRIVAGGCVFGTGSHLCSPFPPSMVMQRSDLGLADGAEEIRKRVRQICFLEADVIKTCSASGASTGEFRWRNYTLDELIVLCDEAQAWGRAVACHSHAAHGISKIVQASAATGVKTTIEHGTFLKDCDPETIKLIKEKRIHFVPTVGESQRPSRQESIRRMAEEHKRNVLALDSVREESFKLALREGVRISFGTDSYPNPFPERAYPGGSEGVPTYRLELETYVKWGMKPIEVIRAMTSTAAEACGIADKTGSIEKGKLADILVVKGNPLDNIGILGDKQNIETVLQNGVVVVRRKAPTE